MGFDVADPFGGDETFAIVGLAAGGEEGGVDGYVRWGGEVDEGDEGCGVCGVEEGEEGGGCVVCCEDGDLEILEPFAGGLLYLLIPIRQSAFEYGCSKAFLCSASFSCSSHRGKKKWREGSEGSGSDQRLTPRERTTTSK